MCHPFTTNQRTHGEEQRREKTKKGEQKDKQQKQKNQQPPSKRKPLKPAETITPSQPHIPAARNPEPSHPPRLTFNGATTAPSSPGNLWKIELCPSTASSSSENQCHPMAQKHQPQRFPLSLTATWTELRRVETLDNSSQPGPEAPHLHRAIFHRPATRAPRPKKTSINRRNLTPLSALAGTTSTVVREVHHQWLMRHPTSHHHPARRTSLMP